MELYAPYARVPFPFPLRLFSPSSPLDFFASGEKNYGFSDRLIIDWFRLFVTDIFVVFLGCVFVESGLL